MLPDLNIKEEFDKHASVTNKTNAPKLKRKDNLPETTMMTMLGPTVVEMRGRTILTVKHLPETTMMTVLGPTMVEMKRKIWYIQNRYDTLWLSALMYFHSLMTFHTLARVEATQRRLCLKNSSNSSGQYVSLVDAAQYSILQPLWTFNQQ